MHPEENTDGKETSDPDNGGQFPYFNELHALFSSSSNNVHRLQLESEAGSQQARKRPRRSSRDQSSEEISDEEGYAYQSDEVKLARSNVAPKKKIEKEKRPRTSNAEKPHSRQPSLGEY
ncbi:hypothetical protein RND71_023480 [Anisodus tanguticus]|uniref:Uncharacterized protein n=1 Tax=Anisodus tanguticus TaxID=243964 RepID=A0AAE1RUG8_9SOLA|nr:hypothetical protein RND71_023480 [Anisodus tanguticus]